MTTSTDKPVLVIFGDKSSEISLQPGVTTADVLASLRLSDDHFLSTRDGQPFGANEEIYDQVSAGQKLFISAPASVAG